MAGSSLFTLLDDIATLLDDVAILSKVAAKKTAGVLGDDLALNAEQVSGIRAERELPVVWAVFKGSAINKAIMVPIALLLSAFAPWSIMPLLMLGGAFLCFEGFEKVTHRYLHAEDEKEEHKKRLEAVADDTVDMVAFEKRRIRGAIRTDAILSAEIIVIVLGTVQQAPLGTRIAVLTFLAAAITIGVYGLVAGIVKMDDVGIHLIGKTEEFRTARFQRWLGRLILRAAPKLMTTLSVVGTAAMFLVGGGILVHGLPIVAEGLHVVEHWAEALPAGGFFSIIAAMLYNGIFGFLAGGLIVGIFLLGKKLLPGRSAAHLVPFLAMFLALGACGSSHDAGHDSDEMVHAGPAMNYHRVSDTLVTGGHLVGDGVATLKEEGVTLVIDLRDEPPGDHGARLADAGIRYINVPVVWSSPKAEDFEEFARHMSENAGEHILVQCQANYRASAMTYAYRVAKAGVPEAEARQDLEVIWTPEGTWEAYLTEILSN